MERNEILKKINMIFKDTFNLDDSISITNDTTANDIEEWNSLNYTFILIKIEKLFNINLSMTEIIKWSNIGDMVNTIFKKVN